MSDEGPGVENNLLVDASLYGALISVNRLFSRSLDQSEGELFDAIVNLLVDQLDLALALVAVLPEGKEWVEFRSVAGSAKGYAHDLRVAARDDIREGQGPIRVAMRTGEVVVIDIDDDRFLPWRERAVEFGLGGGMAVPFRFADETVGVLCLYRQRHKPFLTQLHNLMAQLGADLSDFLRRQREHVQLSRLREYQEAAGQLLHRLLAIPDPYTAFGEATSILTEKTDAMGAWVSVPDGDHLRTVAGRCKEKVRGLGADLWEFRPKLLDDRSPASLSVAARAFRSGRPVIESENRSHHLRGLKTVYSSLAFVRVAGAWPIVVSGKPIAVLVMVSDDAEYFSPVLTALLEQLIDGLRIAIQNFEAQAEARRISRVYQALLTEGDLLLTVQNENEFLTQACTRLLESGLYRTVWIGIQNENGHLEPLISTGENTSELDVLARTALGQNEAQTASERAVISGGTVVVRDYVSDPSNAQWAAIAERNSWRSSVSMPIERHGKAWGVLSVLSDRLDGFSEDMVELLSRISQMISHGLSEIDLREELNSERDKQSWLASHDPLTGLPNRRGLEDHISEAIARSKRHGTILVVGMLDLDDFKVVNDTYGHDLGDKALRDLTGSLRDSLRQTDLLARVGGDEFVLVLEDVRRFSDLTKILQKFESVLHSPLVLPDGNLVIVGGSLGLSVCAGDALTPNELLHSADQALYLLKSRKGHRTRAWAFHSPDDPDGISTYPRLISDGRSAEDGGDIAKLLHSGGLQILYHPVANLLTGEIVGVEALARLVSPKGIVHLPQEFMAELSLEDQKVLTLKVLSVVEKDLSRLEQDGFRLWCSINVASDLIMSDAYLADLLKAFSKSKLGPSRITLEVLDGVSFLSTPDAWRRLIALNEKGLDLALDDISTSYSSLLRVQELPLSKVKVDQEFVRNLAVQPNGFRFLIAMLELSRRLNMGFVAEGAETLGILDALISLGVEYAQGFAISPPLTFRNFEAWLPSFRLDVSVARPVTMLGLYALFVRDSFGYYQRLVAGLEPLDIGGCPRKGYLKNLGLEGGRLDKAHDAYHEALQKFHGAIDRKPNPYLRLVEEARERVRKLILEELDLSSA